MTELNRNIMFSTLIFVIFFVSSCTSTQSDNNNHSPTKASSTRPYKSKYYGIYVCGEQKAAIKIEGDALTMSILPINKTNGIPIFIDGATDYKYVYVINENNIKVTQPNSSSSIEFGTFRDMGNDEIYLEYQNNRYKKETQSDLKLRSNKVETSTGFKFSGETAIDTRTNLMWARVPGFFGKASWLTANNIKSISYAGYNDWRLPTASEMRVLIDYASGDAESYFNSIGFTGVSDMYWTSTLSSQHENMAVILLLNVYDTEEYKHIKDEVSNVWPVRVYK